MTLLQLKYIDAVTKSGSINRAAKKLFVSQSSISIAIRDLEDEIGISIFSRTNKGVALTKDGRLFYERILPILEQDAFIHTCYVKKDHPSSYRLHVSSQHYPFVVKAFAEAIEGAPSGRYDMQLKETDTLSILDGVSSGESDIGILFLSNSVSHLLKQLLFERGLEFNLLLTVRPHVFMRKEHPLAQREEVDIKDLSRYPYAIFARDGTEGAFSEEVLLDDFEPSSMIISISDRCTMYNILASSDAFSIGSGLLIPGFSDPGIVARPLSRTPDRVSIGWLKRKNAPLTEPAEHFLHQLRLCLSDDAMALQ